MREYITSSVEGLRSTQGKTKYKSRGSAFYLQHFTTQAEELEERQQRVLLEYEQDVHIDYHDPRQIGGSGMHCEPGNGTSSLAFLLSSVSITILSQWQTCSSGKRSQGRPMMAAKKEGNQIGGSAGRDRKRMIS